MFIDRYLISLPDELRAFCEHRDHQTKSRSFQSGCVDTSSEKLSKCFICSLPVQPRSKRLLHSLIQPIDTDNTLVLLSATASRDKRLVYFTLLMQFNLPSSRYRYDAFFKTGNESLLIGSRPPLSRKW